MSLGLAGKLGAQGSLSLGQQCSRENTHEPCVEHFPGLTHGCLLLPDRGGHEEHQAAGHLSGQKSLLPQPRPAWDLQNLSVCLPAQSMGCFCLVGFGFFLSCAACGILVP